MKKLNGSIYVVIAFGLFMVFIITLVVKTYQFKVDLVSEDYYGQELRYEEKINKMRHVADHDKTIRLEQDTTGVTLHFRDSLRQEQLTGQVEFFRPSDSSKDLIVPIQVQEGGTQHFRKELFVTGLYKIKIDWSANGVEYYTEQDLYIQ